MIRSNNAYDVIQKVYYWIQTTVAIIIPTVAMLVCSILIVKQFTFKVRLCRLLSSLTVVFQNNNDDMENTRLICIH